MTKTCVPAPNILPWPQFRNRNGAPLFRELLEQRLHLLAEFTRRFYPLTETAIETGDYDKKMHGWPEGPLPWEGACI